ncbi:MAG TPA: hypothetical protein VHF87_05740 [Methylomirabilota bacterium]|jgi:hypothetical protein|nr:hypothetical protein [Methylomirabilota bacterium]
MVAVLVLAAYATAHFGMRVAVSGTAELDEAEQLVLTQALALGYDDQPPLYTWIQALALRVLETGIPALALVKNGLLFGTHLFVFLSARSVLGGVGPPSWPRGRLRAFALLAFLASLVTLAAPDLQVWIGPRYGAYSRLNVPFGALAAEIRRSGFRGDTILAEGVFLAGNLRLAFPRARGHPGAPGGRRREGRGRPGNVARARRRGRAGGARRVGRPPHRRGACRGSAPRHAEAPLGGVKRRTYRIGFVMLTPLVRASSLR